MPRISKMTEKERKAKYYQENKEEVKRRASIWASENKEKRSIISKRYREKNKDAVRKRITDWYNNNKDSYRVYCINRRRKLKTNGNGLSVNISKRLMSIQRSRCAACNTKIKNSNYHLDHIMPVALGGKNEDRNIQILCPKCNLEKGTKDPILFMQERGFLL